MFQQYPEISSHGFVTEGFGHIRDFITPDDLSRAQREAEGFYQNALDTGLFYTADEARSLGLLGSDGGPRRRVQRERNLMYSDMAWFQESESFRRLVRHMMVFIGPDLDMFLARLIVTVPLAHIPAYIQELHLPMHNKLHGSLNTFVRDDHLRAFFFIHNPWHQDWVDFPDSDMRFVTTLLPITERAGGQAPLYILPSSAAVEPLPLPIAHKTDGETVTLFDGAVPRSFERRRVGAGPGDLLMWPARTFHLVDVNTADRPAMNLRFTFAPAGARTGVIDKTNIVHVSRSALTQMGESGPSDPNAPHFVPAPDVRPAVVRSDYAP